MAEFKGSEEKCFNYEDFLIYVDNNTKKNLQDSITTIEYVNQKFGSYIKFSNNAVKYECGCGESVFF